MFNQIPMFVVNQMLVASASNSFLDVMLYEINFKF